MSKPDSSGEVAKEEEMEFIFRLPTSTTIFGDVDRKSTCSHSSGERLPQQSPSKGLDFGNEVLLLPSCFQQSLHLIRNRSGSVPGVSVNVLQTQIMLGFRVENKKFRHYESQTQERI